MSEEDIANLACFFSFLSLKDVAEGDKFSDFLRNRSTQTRHNLSTLRTILPDTSPSFLLARCQQFVGDTTSLEDWVTEHKMEVDLVKGRGESLWACPGCHTHQKLRASASNHTCSTCSRTYCVECLRLQHFPHPCTGAPTTLTDQPYSTDVFRRLEIPPSSEKNGVRRFLMPPLKDIDWSNPLDILYMLVESTFLRMADRTTQQLTSGINNMNYQYGFGTTYAIKEKSSGQRSFFGGSFIQRRSRSIRSIEYVENQQLRENFLAKQKQLKSEGVNCKERLVFHGTMLDNIDGIVRDNFQLGRLVRKVFGRGVYFSEIPDISAVYGDGLLLCRVLLGEVWSDSTSRDIPPPYHSKVVKTDSEGRGKVIVVADTEFILPAFVIKLL